MDEKARMDLENEIIAKLREDFADYIDVDTPITYTWDESDYCKTSALGLKAKTGRRIIVNGIGGYDEYIPTAVWKAVATAWLDDSSADHGEKKQIGIHYHNGSIRGDQNKNLPFPHTCSDREMDIRHRLAFE